jgi:2',3'-cyclic-nucleotide 2'-phosphodiesterase (5'-nucleotidase family)
VSFHRYLGIFTVTFFVSSCAVNEISPIDLSSSEPGEVRMTLIHQSNRFGVTEPCGCEITPIGGVDREANAISQIRVDSPNAFYVDAGNMYVKRIAPAEYQRRRTEVLTEIMNKMRLDVFAPGPSDFALGIETLRKAQGQANYKFVSTNVVDKDGKTVFEPFTVVRHGDLAVAFVSITPSGKVEGFEAIDPVKALSKWVPEARKKASFVVLLSQLNNIELGKIMDQLDVQVVVGSDPTLFLDEALVERKGQTLLVEPANYGYQVGRLDIDIKIPFKGFSSRLAQQKQKDRLESYEKEYAKNPAAMAKFMKEMRKEPRITLIEGGSWFFGQMIALDKERFGTPNELTKMMEKERALMRKEALSE